MEQAQYIFEVSWEVCNKIGGIYTVLASKSPIIQDIYHDKYIVIGPDIWKGVSENPDFIQDDQLFADWLPHAKANGINVRVGRWNIANKPIAILVDFTPFIADKDTVFKKLWETYKLDSISGGWDYIEPALFGYAAGKAIESFYKFYLDPYQHVIAHFHEWMTGGGVLYLESNTPFISTVFTTHATVLGRSISSNGQELYNQLPLLLPTQKASELRVVSKNSLEQKAAKAADTFTTVSEITAKECVQFLGRNPDVITINGFDDQFVPTGKKFTDIRKSGKKKILEVASRLIGKELPEDTFMVLNSGRYEFQNKGIDLFIDAIGELKNRKEKRELLGIIAVPAGSFSPLPQLVENKGQAIEGRDKYVTHLFNNMDHDQVLNKIKSTGITNNPDQNTHIIFVPCYLNARDQVFNLDYYQFLAAMDYTVFPSYYEPWGYTPMESAAFGIPTLTTRLAGFGKWVTDNFGLEQKAVTVIERNYNNNEGANKIIAEAIRYFLTTADNKKISKTAREIAEAAHWKYLCNNYFRAWEIALLNSRDRKKQLALPTIQVNYEIGTQVQHSEPNWKNLMVKTEFPPALKALKDLTSNIWWSWSDRAKKLMLSIGGSELKTENPIKRLETLSMESMNKLISDQAFLKELNEIHAEYKAYIERPKNPECPQIVYFSMEYGLHTSIKSYSGGLGVLAGDYLKQASDSNKKLMAIGLLYKNGYFKQEINISGDQIATTKAQNFAHLPITPVEESDGSWMFINLVFPGRIVTAKVWKLMVGTIPLYLLDTDVEENKEEDRSLTHNLYGGDKEDRLKQELLLGFGGIRLLKKLNINPDVYHSNEGHSAFIGIERIRQLIETQRLDFNSAFEVVRSSTLFTTHTPVPAGHDKFKEDLMRIYLGHYPNYLGIDWEAFIGLGRANVNDKNEEFSMSVLATKLSRDVNGVSRLHGRVSRDMFQPMYPAYFANEVNVGYVTNGVHYHTWTDEVWKDTYRKNFGPDFEHEQADPKHWEKIYQVPDKEIWENRVKVKQKMIDEVLRKFDSNLNYYQNNPKVLLKLRNNLKSNALIFGFARRFATYKRATLLFTNLERLEAIVSNPDRPVLFFFAGKAHPKDVEGQNLIKRIIEISRLAQFEGKILFLENYDMTLGKLLTSGVDVWLNTPTRPLEASGTSGQKAILNGVLNFSVMDGWWAEGFREEAGWSLEERRRFESQESQDQLDAAKIYDKILNDISVKFFDLDENGIPVKWVRMIKNNIAWICPHFTMQRMMEDYYNQYYLALRKSSDTMKADNYKNAFELSEWKQKIRQNWDQIKVVRTRLLDSNIVPLEIDQEFLAEITVDIPGLNKEDIGIEVVIGSKNTDGKYVVELVEQLKVVYSEDNQVTYKCSFPLHRAGMHNYAFRLYPKNALLNSRMDFPLVKWI